MSNRAPPAAPSRAPSARAQQHDTTTSTTHPSIRRNLFQPALSRRPGTAASSSSASTATLALHAPDSPPLAPAAPARVASRKMSGRGAWNEEKVRGRSRGGSVMSTGVGASASAGDVFGGRADGGTQEEEEEEEEEYGDIVARDESGSYIVDTLGLMMPPMPGAKEDGDDELAEDEMRLIEILGRGGELSGEIHGELELKASLAASLQAKLASLDRDRWMFESEDVGSP